MAPSGTDYSGFDSDSLGRCVDKLHGISNAAVAEIFAIVCELDRRGEFASHGAKDAASWLHLRLGISYATAARWAEVALGLKDLLHLRQAFASGRLSLDKLPAAIELATPESDSWVAQEAIRLSIRALEVAARRRREVTAEEEKEARRRRRVWWAWTNGGTMLLLSARLTAEQGARVTAALERTATRLDSVDDAGVVSMAQRRADALAQLASVQIASDADQDRATMMVHVDFDTLRNGIGSGWTEDGALLSAETVSKLLCDSRLKALVEDENGKPLGVGRTMRHAPRWMRHALRVRDVTCCFPGCDRTDFLVPHHKDEWEKHLGPTDPDNLPLACPTHHRLLHCPDWRVEGSPSEGLVFVGPKGRVRDGPPPLDYDVRKWLWEDLYRPSSELLFDTS